MNKDTDTAKAEERSGEGGKNRTRKRFPRLVLAGLWVLLGALAGAGVMKWYGLPAGVSLVLGFNLTAVGFLGTVTAAVVFAPNDSGEKG